MDYTVSPWNSPGQYTGVGSGFLLQEIFPTRIEPRSPALQADSLPTELSGKYPWKTEMQAHLINVWILITQVPLIFIFLEVTLNFEAIRHIGLHMWSLLLLPWLGARLQTFESRGGPSGCVSWVVLTHPAGCKQPLSICQVTAGFLGLEWSVVNSGFTNLHLTDPLPSQFLPQRTRGREQPSAECLLMTTVVVRGITVFRYQYDHGTNSL